MAAFWRESGVARGRGFGSVDGVPSFLNRLKDWITRPVGSGGAGWQIIDDQSAAPGNPYIVCATAASVTNLNRAKVVRFYIPSEADQVWIMFYLHWNPTTHVGLVNYATYYLPTRESIEYGYNFRGGLESLLLMTNISGSWNYVWIDEWTGIPGYLENDFSAVLAQDWLVETGDNNNQVGGYHKLKGYAQHLDANGKLYFSVVANAGASVINIYSDAARTNLIGHTSNSGSLADSTVFEDFASGLSGLITRTAVVANDSDIEVDFRLYFQTGHAALLTPGKPYFIWDLVNGSPRINYFKVISIAGDVVVAEGLNAWTPPAGSVASPYGHRWATSGSVSPANYTTVLQLPYFSAALYEGTRVAATNNSSNTTAITQGDFNWLGGVLLGAAPDDENLYAVMRPIVLEYRNRRVSIRGIEANRIYGQSKNIYLSSDANMAVMQFGRVINAKNYMTFVIAGGYAYLFLDTDSLS